MAGERGRLLYGELGAALRGVASAVVDRLGSGREPVVLLLAHDPGLAAALLGVLAAGKVYVVTDAAQPRDLLAAVVRDSTARLVLTDRTHLPLAREVARSAQVLDIGTLRPGGSHELPFPDDPDAPAAIYYTSGTTGTPKGVLRSHRHLDSSSGTLGDVTAEDDRFALVASGGFSAALGTLLVPLVRGASVSMLDLRERPIEALCAWLDSEGVTIYKSTPSIFRAMARVRGSRPFPSLRLVQLQAEAAYASDVALFRSLTTSSARLRLGFGATEAGLVSARFLEHDEETEPGRLHVGFPPPDVKLAILGEDGAPLPPGEAGRLAITSRRIALGYWRRPDLDAEAFSADPADPSIRTYRTADLARLDPGGALEWLGRVDSQVKVRGQKVDTAAVEAALMSLAGVREAAVVVREGPSGTRLVAYAGGDLTEGRELRRHLAELLPPPMVPSSVVALQSLPRNANGKVDRRALPDPPHAPATAGDVPEDLTAVWEEALGRTGARPGDDFFDSGGDSITAVSLLTGIATRFGVDLPPTVLWEAPTLGELALVVAAKGETAARTLVVVRDGQEPPLFYVPSGFKAFRAEHTDLVGLHALARLLGPEPPLLAFHYDPRQLGTEVIAIEDVASRFVAAMRARQPSGPYRLCGYSIGGRVAWEMARQLAEAGEVVSLLVLIDTPGPGYPRRRSPRERLYWINFAERAARVVARAGHLGISAGAREALRAARAYSRRGLGGDPPAPGILRWGPYSYRPLPLPIVLLRAEPQASNSWLDYSDRTNGFGPYTPGIDVVSIPGGHSDALRPGQIEIVASVLASRLRPPAGTPCC